MENGLNAEHTSRRSAGVSDGRVGDYLPKKIELLLEAMRATLEK
jgi:hypothetical protein